MPAATKKPAARARKPARIAWSTDLPFDEKIRLALKALSDAKNNRTKAAGMLGITRAGLSNFVNRHAERMGLADAIDCPKCGHRIKIADARRSAPRPGAAAPASTSAAAPASQPAALKAES